MDVLVSFLYGDKWSAFFLTLQDINPYVILGLCALATWCRLRLNRYEGAEDERLNYGLKDPEAPFDFDAKVKEAETTQLKVKGRKKVFGHSLIGLPISSRSCH